MRPCASVLQIQVARAVQRLVDLERLYMDVVIGSGENETSRRSAQRDAVAAEATAALIDKSKDLSDSTSALSKRASLEWAAAANVSLSQLKAELAAGVRARDQIVASNTGLVHHEINKLKRACGGRLDQGTTEQDLLQEGRFLFTSASTRVGSAKRWRPSL